MTDNKKDIQQPKKLTLGGSKLTFNKSLLSFGSNKTMGGIGTNVVVEVKRGKVLQASNFSLNQQTTESSSDEIQAIRRLSALQRSQAEPDQKDKNISTLSKLAEMNQVVEDLITEDTALPIAPVIEDHKEKPQSIVKKEPPKTFKSKADNDAEDLLLQKKESEEKVAITKQKAIEPKKLKKSEIIHMLESDGAMKIRSLASIRRAKAKEKRKSEDKKQDKVYREVIIPEVITVGELANRMTERSADVTRELMKLGIMATSTQSIDADTAELLVTTFGHTPKRVQESDVENILSDYEDNPEDMKPRAPVVTVMGHVDHGKTSLLDALKSTDVAAGEAGGITQHIGAYSVMLSDEKMITFIDTPGHEAFTEMRMRGARVTDIVVLVVAGDDGIKAQTVEAISHAKAAGVPIIVAINKMDKPAADIDKVKQGLLLHELVPEDMGGDIITVPVSALNRTNLDKLEEVILLVAEMQELKANPNAMASGVVIESRIDKNMGVVTTVLVQRGTLKKGDLVVAGTTYGRVKLMNNDKGMVVDDAKPSFAVEIYGLTDSPSAGDIFNVVNIDRQARDITDYRLRKNKDSKVTAFNTSLEELFQKASGTGFIKELPIIIKGDVHGSIEAIISSLNKIESDEVKIKVLHSGVGGITESDVTLAIASGAIILGFNVRANNAASMSANKNKVDIRYFSIIYNLIDDIKAIMSGMLSPIIREVYIGSVSIREVFNVSKVGKVAGSYVTKGIIKRGAGVRLLRDDIVIHEGKLKTLKRFKEDVKEVREGFECGVAFENYEDIKVGDLLEVFEIVEEKKYL
jgi:translation initiation factor IF-2